MTHIWQGLRSGKWLTVSRARNYSLILLGLYALAIVAWIALSDGLIDRNGKPIGTDFSSFYAAGKLVLEGRAGNVYDMATHYAREKQMFGPDTPYYGWFYPPVFLFVAAALALLPYALALVVWQGACLAFYLATIATILRRARQDSDAVSRLWLPVAAASPAVFINLGHGQNGLLSASLFGAALLALARRPLLAGALFGLLAYKPQFALLIPFALLAAGRWQSISAAVITVIAIAGAACLAFGPEIWWLFAQSAETSRRLLLEQGEVGFEKLQSIFAVVRMWGGGAALAYAFQSALSATALGGVVWIWRSSAGFDVKAAALIIASLFASPHVLDYDLAILGPAIAFLVACGCTNGFRDYEITLLAAAWIVPLLSRSIAGATGIPLGFLMLLSLYGSILRRAAIDRTVATSRVTQIAQA